MLEAILFQLVPAWTTLFFKTKNKSIAGTEEAKLAALIVRQSSKVRIKDDFLCDPADTEERDVFTSPDTCWLTADTNDRYLASKYPASEEIRDCPYPALRQMIVKYQQQFVAPSWLSHSEYVAFCFSLYEIDQPQYVANAINHADENQRFYLATIGELRARLRILTTDLHKIVMNLHSRVSGDFIQFVSAGFCADPPNPVSKQQIMESYVLAKVGRNMCSRDRTLVFRLERFINATKSDLVHLLDLTEDNLKRHYDTMCLALQTASVIGSGPLEVVVKAGRVIAECNRNIAVPGNEDDDEAEEQGGNRSLNWTRVIYPTPRDPDLVITNITNTENAMTPTQRTAKNLFNALLALLTLRSAFLDEDGSVHQKIWHVERVDGDNSEGFENALENSTVVQSRTWLHAVQKVHENLGELFASLHGRHVLSIISLLMTGSNGFMRVLLKQWPALKVARRNEHFTGFPNGILNTSTGQFISLGHPQRLLPVSLVAAKYFQGLHYPSTTLNLICAANEGREREEAARVAYARELGTSEEQMEDEREPESMRGVASDRRKTLRTYRIPDLLPFKGLRIVLETQKYTRAEIGNVMAMMGRTRHALRELDQFDVMNIVLGPAGTGKSTILDMLKTVFDRGDLGFMQNKLEREFGLESFYKKKLVIGPDLNHQFTLDQAMLHSMIVGEGVTVCRKSRRALSVLWSAHLFWSLNVIPGKYQDSDFSLLRRLFTTLFTIVLQEKCPNLLLDFEKFELPIFLYLIVWHYHELLNHKPGASIWDICEPKFLEIRKNLLSQLNVLEGFLRSTRLERSPLVAIKLDLAGMKIEDEQSYKKEHLMLLDAKYEVDSAHDQLRIRFPDQSVLETDSELCVDPNDFWKAFHEFSPQKIDVKEDYYRGPFSRYGILEAKKLPGHHKPVFVGIRLAG